MTKKNILFLLFLLLSAGTFAQGGFVISPMSVNGPLIQKHNELQTKSMLFVGSIHDTIPLGATGFIDDFSYEGPYPDTSKWLDNSVYINRDYPIAPPSLGVATFDGVNALGYPYDFFAGQYSTGKADTLTSKPIDLNLPGDTSVYFSFFYQPQGRGNFPDRDDSLILEFKNVLSGSWDHVWATPGRTTDITDSSWTRVRLQVAKPAYLMKGFQFRFTNWATLSGNGDHWHIDYVYLNKNRADIASDTVYNDLAFVYNTPSLLNTYSNVPWEQYTTSMMKGTYSTTLRNNGPSSFAQFSYRILDTAGMQVNTTYSGGVSNMDPYSTSGYMNYPPFTSPPVNYTIPALSGKTYYIMQSIVGVTTSSPPGSDRLLENDTVNHLQLFDNFYAYDDNTAELSFGLQGFIHAQLAEKYTTSVDDSLRAVDIYFNPQWTDASQFTFKLKVWGDGGTHPGSALYTNVALDTPQYNMWGRNQFTRYYLEHPLFIGGGSTFYIGFDQNTASPINIGVDANTNSQMMTFYSTSGTWYNPPFPGSLMMRPIFGTAAGAVGIDTYNKPAKSFTVYPNPARDQLYLQYSGASPDEEVTYSVTDMLGRSITERKGIVPPSIDISSLENGIYFVRIVSQSGVFASKFIVSK